MPKHSHHGKQKKYCGKHEIDYIYGAITNKGVTDRQLAAYFHDNYTYNDIANLHDPLGRTALHMAASCGRAELCEWLILVAGADVNAKDWESGYTPLQRALYNAHIRTAVSLMKIGADLMSVDKGGVDAIYGLIKDRQPVWVRVRKDLPAQVSIWGSNDNYTLGIGTNKTRRTPEVMDNFKRRNVEIDKVLIDEFHSIFKSSCNRVWVCGNPQGGRLGIPSKNHCLTPTLLCQNMAIMDVAISLNHTLILFPANNVLACGQNDHYQLGISPYLKETATLKPVSISVSAAGHFPSHNELCGVLAGKYHSVFFTHAAVYVCGLNGGQLGISNTTDNVPYVKVPTLVPLNLKPGSKITSISTSSSCIVLSVDCTAFYVLNQFTFKKIAPPQLKRLKIEQVATFGGSISNNLVTENFGPLKVAVLTMYGSIFIWHESFPELKRCWLGLSRVVRVTYIFLNERQILFTSNEGEAFSGTIDKPIVTISKETDSGFQKFLAENESYDLQAKRIPNIHRAVAITSDPKGKNFAVRQTNPSDSVGTCRCNKMEDPAFSQYHQLLEETSLEDQLHDITFKVQNTLYPAHKYIVANANSTLLDFPMKDGLIVIEDILAVIFKEVLMFIYTGSSDLLLIGPIHPKFSNCAEDALKLFHSASIRFKLESLSEKILHYKYERTQGQIRLNHSRVNQLPTFIVPRYNRQSYPEFYDIVIKTNDGKIIKAHKCILVTRLEYFHHMLMGGWTESSTTEINMDFPLKYLELLLDYLYTDDAHSTLRTESFEDIGRLLIICDQLICDTLKVKCEMELVHAVTLKNVASLLKMSILYNADLLREYVMEFMVFNMDAIFENRILEILDDDILTKVEESYKLLNGDVFRYRFIYPFTEYTIPDEQILSSPEIPWPPALTENYGETPKIKNKELKERQQKMTTVIQKKKATPPKKTTVTEIIETTVCAGSPSPPDHYTVLNESDFPLLDYPYSTSYEYRGCRYKPHCMQSSGARKVFPPRMSQKERMMASWTNLDKRTVETEESPPEMEERAQFKGWAVIPPLENLNKDKEIANSPPTASSFVEIIASEQKEKDNFIKMKTKPFALTQLEDKAIEELNQFYNASNVFDERITVQRVIPINIAKPTWIKSHKNVFH